MKIKRWDCSACWRRKCVERDGEGHDGRPRYRCWCCGNTYTKGHQGEPDDPVPSRFGEEAGDE